MDIDRLIAISDDLGLTNETTQLQLIRARSTKENCELILPLIGEFSAGKTALINALLDSDNKLETNPEPTTSTLFEIHFGAERSYAQVIQSNGETQEFEDISDIKNKEIENALVVNVHDTSTKIHSNIILVDTPGLSSLNHQHRQVLADFLPNADAVLLVVDVNAQMTRSLTDFISTMELAKRPVFLIITKCDTKSAQDVNKTVNYLIHESKLPLRKVVTVSAKVKDLQNLYDLLASIHQEKNSILVQANTQRIKNITEAMIAHIDEMLSVSNSNEEMNQAIYNAENELRCFNSKIDSLINHSQMAIEDEMIRIIGRFEDTIFKRLDSIVSAKKANFNAEAIAAINDISSINLNEFKSNTNRIIKDVCIRDNDTGIDLQSIQSIDLSQLTVDNLIYNLDLDTIGHEYDKHIAIGVKAVAAVMTVATVAVTAGSIAPVVMGTAGTAAAGTGAVAAGTGAAAAGTGAAAAGTAVAATATAVSVVDTATNIAGMISNAKTSSRVQRAIQYTQMAGKQYSSLNQIDQVIGDQAGRSKGTGLIEGLVGLVTDKAWGKPQRHKAIHEYIDNTLIPMFKNAMQRNLQQVISNIKDTILKAAQISIDEKKCALEALIKQSEERKEDFKQQLDKLRDYKNELLTQ